MGNQCYTDARLDRLLRHLPNSDDMSLIALKGHLLIEEVLDDLIVNRCRSPKSLNDVDISFRVKSRIARALWGSSLRTGFELPANTWALIDALNSLRNAYAHNLESPDVDRKIAKIAQLAFSNVERPAWVKTQRDELRMAIHILHAVMTAFEARTKRIRARPSSIS